MYVIISSIVISTANATGLFPSTVDVATTNYDTSGVLITKLAGQTGVAGGPLLGVAYMLWQAFTIAIVALYNALLIGPYLMTTYHVPLLLAGAAQAIVSPAFGFEIYMFLKGINVL